MSFLGMYVLVGFTLVSVHQQECCAHGVLFSVVPDGILGK